MLSRCNGVPTLRHSMSAVNTSQHARNPYRNDMTRINTVHKFETIESICEPQDDATSNNTNNNVHKKAFANISTINENMHLSEDKDKHNVPFVQIKLNAMTERIRKNIEFLKNRNNNSGQNEPITNTQSTKDMPKITSKVSINSTVSSTISNSSLQEVDDEELNSEDLAKYMSQVNTTIRCNQNDKDCSCKKSSKGSK